MHSRCALVVRADARTSMVTCEWTNESKYFGFNYNRMDFVRTWGQMSWCYKHVPCRYTSSRYYVIYTFSKLILFIMIRPYLPDENVYEVEVFMVIVRKVMLIKT